MTDHRELIEEMIQTTVEKHGSHAFAAGGLGSLVAVLMDTLEEPSKRYAMNVLKHLRDWNG